MSLEPQAVSEALSPVESGGVCPATHPDFGHCFIDADEHAAPGGQDYHESEHGSWPVTPKSAGVDLPRDWRAVHIEPGTPFWDEPSETQPPGWFVFGGFTDDPEEGAAFVLNVEQALDRDDTGVSLEHVAKVVAARLNGGASA